MDRLSGGSAITQLLNPLFQPEIVILFIQIGEGTCDFRMHGHLTQWTYQGFVIGPDGFWRIHCGAAAADGAGRLARNGIKVTVR